MYTFISVLIKEDSYKYIIEVGITIAMVIAGWKVKDGDFMQFGKDLIAPLGILALFFLPTSNVHIVDLRVDEGMISASQTTDGGYTEVDNIPFAIAFIPSTSSILVSSFIDLIDDSFGTASLSSPTPFSVAGYGTMYKIFKEGMKVENLKNIESNVTVSVSNADGTTTDESITSGEIEDDILQYLGKCVLSTLKSSTMTKLKNPKEKFPTMLSPTTLGIDGTKEVTIIDYNDNTQEDKMSCTDAYTKFVSGRETGITDLMRKRLESKFKNVDFDSTQFTNAFSNFIGDSANKVGSIESAMAMTVMNRLIQRQQHIDSLNTDGTSLAVDLSIDTSLAKLRVEGLAKFEWLNQVLPDALNIILGIMIASFPLMVLVTTFLGSNAIMNISNYAMGYIAFNFNLVSLALVHHIIGFYTSQQAQATITNLSGIPFGANVIDEFIMKQADMAGLAGLIGTASVFAMTGLIFKGETQGFSSALQSISGAFSGNVSATAKDALKSGALEQEVNNKQREKIQDMEDLGIMTEEKAQSWLTEGGYSTRAGVSALQTYSEIQQGASQIGSGMASKALYEGNMGESNMSNFIDGNQVTATQNTAKTAGLGNNIGSVQSAGDVAFQDGQVMAETVNATHDMRNNKGYEYDVQAIGTGMASQQFAKDMGAQFTGDRILQDDINQFTQNNSSGIGRMLGTELASNNLDNAQSQMSNEDASQQILDNGQRIEDIDNQSRDNKLQIAKNNETMDNPDTSDFDRAVLSNANSNLRENEESLKQERDNLSDSTNNLANQLGMSDNLNSQQKIDNARDILDASNVKDSTDGSALSLLNAPFGEQEYNNLTSNSSLKSQSDINNEVANASQQFADMNDALNGTELRDYSNTPGMVNNALASLVANSQNQAMQQIASGTGLINSGAFNPNGTLANNTQAQHLEQGTMLQSLQKASQTIGFGKTGNADDIKKVGEQDGGVQGKVVSDTRELRDNTKVKDKSGKEVSWNEEDIAKGQALAMVGKDFGSMGTKMAMKEQDGINNFMSGNTHQAQEGANTTIAKGEFRDNVLDGKVKKFIKDENGNTIEDGIADIDSVMSAIKTSTKAKSVSEFESGLLTEQEFGRDIDKDSVNLSPASIHKNKQKEEAQSQQDNLPTSMQDLVGKDINKEIINDMLNSGIIGSKDSNKSLSTDNPIDDKETSLLANLRSKEASQPTNSNNQDINPNNTLASFLGNPQSGNNLSQVAIRQSGLTNTPLMASLLSPNGINTPNNTNNSDNTGTNTNSTNTSDSQILPNIMTTPNNTNNTNNSDNSDTSNNNPNLVSNSPQTVPNVPNTPNTNNINSSTGTGANSTNTDDTVNNNPNVDSGGRATSISYGEMVRAGAEQQLASQIGGAVAYNSVDNSFGRAMDSANLQGQSSLISSSAQIQGAGGIDNLLKVAKTSSMQDGLSSVTALDEKLNKKNIEGGINNNSISGKDLSSNSGMSSDDSKKIAEALSGIAIASGKAEAGSSLAQEQGMNARESMDGKGSFVQSIIDDSIPGALNRGKDFQYFEDWEDGDRDKAIKKMDNISDYQVASKNFKSAVGESALGSNMSTVAEVVEGVGIAGSVYGAMKGANKLLGNPIGKGFEKGANSELEKKAIDVNGAVGKDHNGEQRIFNSAMKLDQDEYMRNNRGASSNLLDKPILNSQPTDSRSNNNSNSKSDDGNSNDIKHNNPPLKNNFNTGSIISKNGSDVKGDSSSKDITIGQANLKISNADFDNEAKKQVSSEWVSNKGNEAVTRADNNISSLKQGVGQYQANLDNQVKGNIAYDKEHSSNYVAPINPNKVDINKYDTGASTPIPISQQKYNVDGLNEAKNKVTQAQTDKQSLIGGIAQVQQSVSSGTSIENLPKQQSGFAKQSLGYSQVSANNIQTKADRVSENAYASMNTPFGLAQSSSQANQVNQAYRVVNSSPQQLSPNNPNSNNNHSAVFGNYANKGGNAGDNAISREQQISETLKEMNQGMSEVSDTNRYSSDQAEDMNQRLENLLSQR